MKRTILSVLTVAGLLVVLPACQSTNSGTTTAPTTAPAMGAINDKCPVMGEDVDLSTAIDYQGNKIAFCCSGCAKKWARRSTAEKNAFVAANTD